MKTKNPILIIILFLFVSPLLNAQAVERFVKKKVNVATDRAGERTDQEIDKKITKSVDKGFDKLLNKVTDETKEGTEDTNTSIEGQESQSESSPSSDESSGTSSAASSARSKAFMKSFGLDAPVNISESYNYKGYMLMDIQQWDEDGKAEDPAVYTTYFNESESSFAMEFNENGKGRSLIIFDDANKIMIILSDDGKEKSGIVTPLSDNSASGIPEDNPEVNTNETSKDTENDNGLHNPNYKKTGRTKMIAGYSCDEYFYEDTESEMSMWITKDMPAELYEKMFSLSAFATLSYAGYGEGFTMEWETKNKNSKERSLMTVKEVDKNKQTSIKTSGYQIYNLGGRSQ